MLAILVIRGAIKKVVKPLTNNLVFTYSKDDKSKELYI